jgi:death-on-curing protein
MDVKLLSQELVILIHDRMIEEEGGLPGVHLNKLEGALSRIDSMVCYEGIDDVYEIAAQYGIAISQGHPFNDANKRTAMACMLLLLSGNHINCQPPNAEIPDFIEKMAKKNFTRSEIADWLRQYTSKI